MKERKFKIVSDSTCDMPKAYYAENDIECVPLGFTMNNVNYEGESGEKIEPKEFYEKLLNGAMPTTYQVTSEQAKEHILPYLKEGGTIVVSILGTDTKDYYVKMEYETIGVKAWETVEEEYPEDNEKGYTDGEQIVSPYTGHEVETYRCTYNKETNELISREREAVSNYRSRDAVICKIIDNTEESEPTDPPPEIGGGGITDGGGALPPE